MRHPPLEVKVWGDYALFTSPLQKMERVSYEVPTPSAARGILEGIYWHAPMRWRIQSITVLKQVQYEGLLPGTPEYEGAEKDRIHRFSLLRNEIAARMSHEATNGLDITENRSQRHALCLRDVAYIIKAQVQLPPGADPNDEIKHRDQFRRRVEKGKCFHRPYFGCREFACHFGPVDDTEQAIPRTDYLGRMLFDLAFVPGRPPADSDATEFLFVHHDANTRQKRTVSGYARRLEFEAYLKPDAKHPGGVLHVPQDHYDQLDSLSVGVPVTDRGDDASKGRRDRKGGAA